LSNAKNPFTKKMAEKTGGVFLTLKSIIQFKTLKNQFINSKNTEKVQTHIINLDILFRAI